VSAPKAYHFAKPTQGTKHFLSMGHSFHEEVSARFGILAIFLLSDSLVLNSQIKHTFFIITMKIYFCKLVEKDNGLISG